MVWTQQAEQTILGLIARLSPEQLDPARTHCQRLGALHIGWSMHADYYLRPNGEVVVVGEDDDHPDVDAVRTDRSTVLRLLVWGSRRYPGLWALLPPRPLDAVDCRCRSIPSFAKRGTSCECHGLGWLTPSEAEPDAAPDPAV